MRVPKGFPEPTHVLTHVMIFRLDTQMNTKSPDLSGLFYFPILLTPCPLVQKVSRADRRAPRNRAGLREPPGGRTGSRRGGQCRAAARPRGWAGENNPNDWPQATD